MMLDDFVERRAALDRWTRRWITTMLVDAMWDAETDLVADSPLFQARMRASLQRRVFNGLVEDEVNVLGWEHLKRGMACRMFVLMQKPREL